MWYASTILATEARKQDNNQVLPMVHLALRVYVENGDKSDAENKKYFGWDKEFDEWVLASSARLQPLHSHSPRDFSSQTQSAQNAISQKKQGDSAEIDDSQDEKLYP